MPTRPVVEFKSNTIFGKPVPDELTRTFRSLVPRSQNDTLAIISLRQTSEDIEEPMAAINIPQIGRMPPGRRR
ncbi:hypothetical protein ASC86_22465 [Rhizobium sp. Root1212]|nr:hypothetical protein ASC86_22465 [Rhizobium sp. Root1212]